MLNVWGTAGRWSPRNSSTIYGKREREREEGWRKGRGRMEGEEREQREEEEGREEKAIRKGGQGGGRERKSREK